MKKKYVLGLMTLFCIVGCANVSELEYDGDELIYSCSENDLELFKENFVVNLDSDQGFVIISEDNEIKEFTDEKVKFKKSDNLNIKSCLFVNYDEVTGNKVGTPVSIKYTVPNVGIIKINMKGNYSYKINDISKYLDYYSDNETITQIINANIIAEYSVHLDGMTLEEILNEKKFPQSVLNDINENIEKIGLKVTQINIESVENVA